MNERHAKHTLSFISPIFFKTGIPVSDLREQGCAPSFPYVQRDLFAASIVFIGSIISFHQMYGLWHEKILSEHHWLLRVHYYFFT
jgi:hypothetical protein